MLWLVNGKFWGRASVRFCDCGVTRGGWRRENSSTYRLDEVKESCISNGCLERLVLSFMANASVQEGNSQELRVVNISYPCNKKFYEIKQGSELLPRPYTPSSPTQADLINSDSASRKYWVAYELSDRAVRDMQVAAGILPILISSTCFEIYKDIVGLRFVAQRWSTRTHTFISAPREFTPTLADDWNYRVEAMLTLLVSRFIFSGLPCDTIRKNLFPMAISLGQGKKLPLAPLFLGQLYKHLDLLAEDELLGLSRFRVETYLSTSFLQVFLWQHFKGYAPIPATLNVVQENLSDFDLSRVSLPLCCRWYYKKPSGRSLSACSDDPEGFCSLPYADTDRLYSSNILRKKESTLPIVIPERRCRRIANRASAISFESGATDEVSHSNKATTQDGKATDSPSQDVANTDGATPVGLVRREKTPYPLETVALSHGTPPRAFETPCTLFGSAQIAQGPLLDNSTDHNREGESHGPLVENTVDHSGEINFFKGVWAFLLRRCHFWRWRFLRWLTSYHWITCLGGFRSCIMSGLGLVLLVLHRDSLADITEDMLLSWRDLFFVIRRLH
ncbi:hypothetical protein TIFTF001_028695 [Ficus carica]|uniref:Aminotransferase-like plant mobile domain-containing protein n=1 Tax=Ficus carica TaxID=3494 RepID=A0AA88DQ66_FICCA|nr:hypothetical protein TIFTF001_028695 [Ficus carica]